MTERNGGLDMAPGAGGIYLAEAQASPMYDYAWKIERECLGAAVRFVRGNKMRSVDSLFDEISAALQFPHYFGENWPAFAECLADLSWINSERYILIMMRAGEILADEPSDMGAFCRSLKLAMKEHADQFSRLHPGDSKTEAFQIILHCFPGKVDCFGALQTNLGVPVSKVKLQNLQDLAARS